MCPCECVRKTMRLCLCNGGGRGGGGQEKILAPGANRSYVMPLNSSLGITATVQYRGNVHKRPSHAFD